MVLSRRAFTGAALALPFAGNTFGQAWPDNTIKVMVPFPAGGTTDIIGRLVAENLQKAFGKPVVVDNLAGATGTIGCAAVARSKPDGYTLLLGSVGTVVTNHFVFEKLPFGIHSFDPIITVAEIPNVLMVRPDLGANTTQELVAMLKAKPGALKHGSPGIASSSHVSAEIFKQKVGATAIHAPYKGSAPMLADLVGGTTDFTIDQISSSLKLIQAGRIKPLAVTTRRRTPQLPDVPTMLEAGIPDYDIAPWFSVSAPAGTPRAVILRINTALNAMLADKEVLAKMETYGAIPVGGSPEDLGRLIQKEEGAMKALAARVNLKGA